MNAVTFGRYDIVTKAHVSTVEAILKKWNKLTIGIVTADISVDFDDSLKWFYDLCDKNHINSKNKHSIDVRKEMWTKTLCELKMSNQVEVVEIKRPEYFPEEFNDLFPKDKFELVFPVHINERNDFDSTRNEAFRKILNREIKTVSPKLLMHSSTIRKYLDGFTELNDKLPKGTLEVLYNLEITKLLNTRVGVEVDENNTISS